MFLYYKKQYLDFRASLIQKVILPTLFIKK